MAWRAEVEQRALRLGERTPHVTHTDDDKQPDGRLGITNHE